MFSAPESGALTVDDAMLGFGLLSFCELTLLCPFFTSSIFVPCVPQLGCSSGLVPSKALGFTFALLPPLQTRWSWQVQKRVPSLVDDCSNVQKHDIA